MSSRFFLRTLCFVSVELVFFFFFIFPCTFFICVFGALVSISVQIFFSLRNNFSLTEQFGFFLVKNNFSLTHS